MLPGDREAFHRYVHLGQALIFPHRLELSALHVLQLHVCITITLLGWAERNFELFFTHLASPWYTDEYSSRPGNAPWKG